MMGKQVDSYRLGNIEVTVTETDDPKKLYVDCNDGAFHSGFTVRVYEFENYKRHMNQKIVQAYQAQHNGD